MKTITPALIFLALLSAAAPGAHAQSPRKIRLALDVRGDNEGAVARVMADVRRELQSLADVELVAAEDATRMIRIVVAGGTGGSSFWAASTLVTERYDRETLMVLGIEDDDTANKMMSLQIVNDHQVVTGTDVSDVAKRLVAALNGGILTRLRR